MPPWFTTPSILPARWSWTARMVPALTPSINSGEGTFGGGIRGNGRDFWISRPPGKLPVVTYISRQNSNRRLADHDHEIIVKCLNGVDGIIFQEIVMENYSFEQQVQYMNETDLLLGVHGNGLTHAAFMKPHRAVCEIYPPGMSFQWDYCTLSKMMGHEYLCIFNGVPIPPCIFTDPGLREHPSCTGGVRWPRSPCWE